MVSNIPSSGERHAVTISAKDIDEKQYMQNPHRVVGYYEEEQYFFKDMQGNIFGPIPEKYRYNDEYVGLRAQNDTLYFSENDRDSSGCFVYERDQETKQAKILLKKPGRDFISNFFITKDKKVIERGEKSITENNRTIENSANAQVRRTSDGGYVVFSKTQDTIKLQANGEQLFNMPFKTPSNILVDRIDMNAGIVALPIYQGNVQLWTKQGKIKEISYQGMLVALKITDDGDLVCLSSSEDGKTYIAINGESQELPLNIKQHQGKIVQSNTIDTIVVQAEDSSGLFKELVLSFDPDAANILAAQNLRKKTLEDQQNLMKILNEQGLSVEDLQKLLDGEKTLVEQKEQIAKLLQKEQEAAALSKQNTLTIAELENEKTELSEQNTKMKTALENIAALLADKITKEESAKGGFFGGGPNKDKIADYNEILTHTNIKNTDENS